MSVCRACRPPRRGIKVGRASHHAFFFFPSPVQRWYSALSPPRQRCAPVTLRGVAVLPPVRFLAPAASSCICRRRIGLRPDAHRAGPRPPIGQAVSTPSARSAFFDGVSIRRTRPAASGPEIVSHAPQERPPFALRCGKETGRGSVRQRLPSAPERRGCFGVLHRPSRIVERQLLSMGSERAHGPPYHLLWLGPLRVSALRDS